MLTLLLAETALELVPGELTSHQSVVAHSKRRKKRADQLLLDSTLHHTAMRKLRDNNRRGRPDIVHMFLLTAFDSIQNQEGLLKVILHTYNDEQIDFNPDIRLPKNFNRFCGLMEQLFVAGRVPEGNAANTQGPFIKLTPERSIKDIVDEERDYAGKAGAASQVIVLSGSGRAVEAKSYFRELGASGSHILCIIGGFPEGTYRTNPEAYEPDDIISLYTGTLKTWTVAAEVLVNFRPEKLKGKTTDTQKDGGQKP